MVAEFRDWLEDETAKLRTAMMDAERWLARWELDATFIEEVERAAALYRVHLQAWETHCQLCEWFAMWSKNVLLRSVAEVTDFGRL